MKVRKLGKFGYGETEVSCGLSLVSAKQGIGSCGTSDDSTAYTSFGMAQFIESEEEKIKDSPVARAITSQRTPALV